MSNKLPTISAEELHAITSKKRQEMMDTKLVVEKWLKKDLPSIIQSMKWAAELFKTETTESIPDDFSDVQHEGMSLRKFLEKNVFVDCRVAFLKEEDRYRDYVWNYSIQITWKNSWEEEEDDEDE